MRDNEFKLKIIDEIQVNFELNYFDKSILRFQEDTFFGNEESDIFIFFNWELTNRISESDHLSLSDFIKENVLKNVKPATLSKKIKFYYESMLENGIYERLVELNILKIDSGQEIFLYHDRRFKYIYLIDLFMKKIKEELSTLVEYLFKNNQFSKDRQQIRLIFREDDFVYFGGLERKSLNIKESINSDFLNLFIYTHSEFINKEITSKVTFKLNEDFNYLEMSKQGIVSKNGINKSIVALLDLSQLVNTIFVDIDSFFLDNVRLFIRNPYVDNSILSSLLDSPETFHIFHNGISIVCNSFNFQISGISLEKINIVNGAQTLYNIVKLVKLQIIDLEFLKGKFILAKIIEVGGQNPNETRNQLSLAANTQKAINLQDLRSNDPNLINFKKLLSKYNIDLLIKRGTKKQFEKLIKVEKFSKLIFSSLYQKPGKARNSSLRNFFDETDSTFDKIFSYSSLKSNNLRILPVLIYLNYLNRIDYYYERLGNPQKYIELYYVAYIFGNLLISNETIIEKVLSEDILEITSLIDFIDIYSEKFINGIIKNIDKYYPKQSYFNIFRSEDLYTLIFEECINVESVINRLK